MLYYRDCFNEKVKWRNLMNFVDNGVELSINLHSDKLPLARHRKTNMGHMKLMRSMVGKRKRSRNDGCVLTTYEGNGTSSLLREQDSGG